MSILNHFDMQYSQVAVLLIEAGRIVACAIHFEIGGL